MRHTMKTLRTALQSTLLASLLAAGLAPAARAQAAAPASPGSGFVDPARPVVSAPPETGVVWRAPAVDTLATLRQRGQLRVCVVPVEPMVMHDAKGDFVGFSIDLSRKLAQDLGVDVDFVPSSWGHVIGDLASRQCDLIASGLWMTVQRALVVNFTAPTVHDGVYLVASQAKAPGKTSLADFDQPGMAVAVYAGTQQEALARKLLPKARLIVTTDDPLQLVLQGQTEAALAPTLSPQTLLQAAPGQLYLPRTAPLASTPAAMAVRKGDPDFLHLLNTWLTLQRDSGWLDERVLFWSNSAQWPK
ncbi:MAG: transporter substrate-binding domain-containing protein [Burkholderiaceae bacterium]|nr:MAG: transporter substrate-binding domain-containing protein [Burkholderiaceae bacterium]